MRRLSLFRGHLAVRLGPESHRSPVCASGSSETLARADLAGAGWESDLRGCRPRLRLTRHGGALRIANDPTA